MLAVLELTRIGFDVLEHEGCHQLSEPQQLPPETLNPT